MDAERAKNRQRLARAIERSFPRELSAFIDYIARDYGHSNKYELHRRALEYARVNFNAAEREKDGA